MNNHVDTSCLSALLSHPAGHKKIIVYTYRNLSLSLSLSKEKQLDYKIYLFVYLFVYFLVCMAVNCHMESILRNLKDIRLDKFRAAAINSGM